ncbi:hypothetical protein D9613_009348 [Agrocybe pediades]|uniref:Uncharacterized protein n=1 Tax=Agrocybe pediades TaxID=84607 RepID=A0A8H4R2F4_9AGAR|nr:hypothetical protein D9613_009348 [Agrocybe pediades]
MVKLSMHCRLDYSVLNSILLFKMSFTVFQLDCNVAQDNNSYASPASSSLEEDTQALFEQLRTARLAAETFLRKWGNESPSPILDDYLLHFLGEVVTHLPDERATVEYAHSRILGEVFSEDEDYEEYDDDDEEEEEEEEERACSWPSHDQAESHCKDCGDVHSIISTASGSPSESETTESPKSLSPGLDRTNWRAVVGIEEA